MSRETTNELRERLLRNAEVQDMIRARAFEIYERSGRAHGRDAEHWFQAEQDVISFLIEEEERRAAAVRRSGNTTATVPESEISAVGAQSDQPTNQSEDGAAIAQTAQEQADTQSALGAWSVTEPAGEERAPSIGEPTESTVESPAPKKRATRAETKAPATRSNTSRKKKSDGSEAKAETKKPVAKTTTRSASSKKAGEASKTKTSTKTSRKQS
jgi:hypothetical protein